MFDAIMVPVLILAGLGLTIWWVYSLPTGGYGHKSEGRSWFFFWWGD